MKADRDTLHILRTLYLEPATINANILESHGGSVHSSRTQNSERDFGWVNLDETILIPAHYS